MTDIKERRETDIKERREKVLHLISTLQCKLDLAHIIHFLPKIELDMHTRQVEAIRAKWEPY